MSKKLSGARHLCRNNLTTRCDARIFGRDVAPFVALISQERAVEALTFGLCLQADGNHILAVDPLGHGRRTALRQTAAEIVAHYWPPAELFDYCYVERPQDTLRPRLLILPAGTAKNLREQVAKALRDTHAETNTYFQGTLWKRDFSQVMERAQTQIAAEIQALQKTFMQNGLPFVVHEQEHWNISAKTLVSLEDWVGQAENEEDKQRRVETVAFAKQIIQEWREANPEPAPEDIALFNILLAQNRLPVELVGEPNGLVPFVHEAIPLGEWIEEGLDESERSRRKEHAYDALQKFLEVLHGAQEILRLTEQTITEHRDEFIAQTVQKHLASILQDYPAANEYVMDLLACVREHPLAFSPSEDIQPQNLEEARDAKERLKDIFNVHVVLAHEPGDTTPPIIQPDDHSYERLFPTVRAEYHMGGLIIDHTKITSGAFLEANGGVLILDFLAMLETSTWPFSWEKLKDSLAHKKIVPEMLGQRHGGVMGEMLEPDPIPLNVKVILALDPDLYEALNEGAENTVADLFRVTAQFAPDTKRTPETERQYAGFVEHQRRTLGLLPFTPSAFARIAEHGSRLADVKTHLSLNMSEIKKLAVEAEYYARTADAKSVRRAHVERALQEQRRRVSLLTQERMLEYMHNGTIFITVQGSEIGRANGLAVLNAAGLAFGIPATVTANTWQSDSFDLSFIDRSVDMTGKTFNKAVETITSIVQERYGKDVAIPFAVRVSFEQMYSTLGGDSASVIGLCLVLSALGDIPLRQDIACTGSLNQKGEVQPIGGQNEKAEGFFDTCKALGGTRGQGVLVPEANVQNLVLRADVVHACQKGKFNVWGYSRWEDAMELLSGMTIHEVDVCIRTRINAMNEKKRQEMFEMMMEPTPQIKMHNQKSR